jgi:hypothetical protein
VRYPSSTSAQSRTLYRRFRCPRPPLSERDPNLLKNSDRQAPFGKGDQTVVDTEVRDTREIDPAKVSFTNPAWTSFVEKVVLNMVWTELGVAPYRTTPKCELYKLLLYETGSQQVIFDLVLRAPGVKFDSIRFNSFLPHQE